MLTYPGFDPIAFQVGRVKVHWYGIMYLLGFAAAWWLARVRAAKPGSTWKAVDVDDLIFYCMLGVILGGRIGYILFYGLKFWAADPWYPLKIWEGGMSFHGGLLGVVAAMTLFGWRRGRSAADVYDFTAPLPALGLFFGRIGNFINSELWGKVTTVPWGFRVDGQVRHPSQLYEASLEGLLLFVVLALFVRGGALKRPGLTTGIFLIGYGAARIFCEFFREPDPQPEQLVSWLTMGMLLSVPMVVAGFAFIVYAMRRRDQGVAAAQPGGP